LELGLRLAMDSNGRTIWIADAHRDHGNRFVVRADADEKLTAFLELNRLLISQRFWRKTKIAAIKVRDATIPLQAISQTRERSEFRAISEPARV